MDIEVVQQDVGRSGRTSDVAWFITIASIFLREIMEKAVKEIIIGRAKDIADEFG